MNRKNELEMEERRIPHHLYLQQQNRDKMCIESTKWTTADMQSMTYSWFGCIALQCGRGSGNKLGTYIVNTE